MELLIAVGFFGLVSAVVYFIFASRPRSLKRPFNGAWTISDSGARRERRFGCMTTMK